MDAWIRYSIERLIELMAAQGFQYENLSPQQRLYGGSVGVALVILLREALQKDGLDSPFFMDAVDAGQVATEIVERLDTEPTQQAVAEVISSLIEKAYLDGAPSSSYLDDALEVVEV